MWVLGRVKCCFLMNGSAYSGHGRRCFWVKNLGHVKMISHVDVQNIAVTE